MDFDGSRKWADRRPKSSKLGSRHRPRRNHARHRPRIESLEDRTLLSGSHYLPPSYFLVNPAPASEAPPGSPGRPLDIALAYLTTHAAELGLTPAELQNPLVTSQYTDTDTGIQHLYLRQSVNGLAVANADFSVGINALGGVISAGGGFVAGLADRLAGEKVRPRLSPVDAVSAAAAGLGLTPDTPPTIISPASGDAHASVIAAPGVSLDDIPAHLQYVPTQDGSAVLAWDLIIRTPDGDHWYDVSVDSARGSIVSLSDWVDDASYNVIALPNDSPQDGGFSVHTDPADPVASPFGWHDTNGTAGAEFTDTRGNNVDAHLDRDDNDVPDPSPGRPNGGATLNFSGFAYNTAQEPTVLANQNAVQTNLFYLNNLNHDIHYQYGFTEAAGNFQLNNYGRGGLGNDDVQANAQDGGGVNNANMATPADGFSPRMQMYLFNLTDPDRDGDLDNGIIIHEYGHGVSNRLTGGPANANALDALQSGGMGEGWSDYYALMFTQRPSDLQNDAFGLGTYVLGEPNNGPGIRRLTYSYDMTTDPLTWDAYGENGTTPYGIDRSTEVHDSGEIWASALWDMTWLLVNKYGFDANLHTGWTASAGPGNAGNKLALRLVMDAMKLQPANPTFIQARDAIIAADNALNGGADLLEIWTAFARRGLGLNATTANSDSTSVTIDFTVPNLNLAVTGSTPANGEIVTTPPVNYVLTVSAPVTPGTLDASDLTVNGHAATGFAYTPGSTTISFSFTTDPVTAEGLQTMHVEAGEFNRASDNNPVGAFDSTFRYDVLRMQVTSTAPADGSIVTLPFTTLDLNFNEAFDPGTVGTGDLVVSQGTVIDADPVDADTARYTLAGVSAEGTLTVNVPAGALADLVGNPMLAYAGSFSLDITTVPFPTPLVAKSLLGSLIYEKEASGIVSFAGDADSFTLNVEAGQTISVVGTPAAGLQMTIELRDPGNVLVDTVTSAAAGNKAVLQTIPSGNGGVFTITVQGAGGMTGEYTLSVTVNAALEAESQDGPSNNTLVTAQDLNASFVSLGGGASRGAVVGITDGSMGGYTAAAVTPTFTDISTTGTKSTAAIVDDAVDTLTPAQLAGFTFLYYGTTYNTLSFSTNGLISFVTPDADFSNTNLSTSPSEPVIAPLWDDLFIEDTGVGTASSNVYWRVIGAGASQQLIIQWNNARELSGSTYFTFQAVLSVNGTIQFNYAGSVDAGAVDDATVGVKSAGASNPQHVVVSYNQSPGPLVGAGLSTRLTVVAPVSDYLSFSLNAGDIATLAVKHPSEGAVKLTLHNAGGALSAQGVSGATNLGQRISNYIAPSTGTYYAQLSDVSIVDYDLVVTKNSAFDTEANNSLVTAQSLGATGHALGAVFDTVVMLSADFTTGNNGFEVDSTGGGLWHLSNGRGAQAGHSPTRSFYYGQGEGASGGGDYDTGSANTGTLTSPSIAIPSGATVAFNYVLETEGAVEWDVAELQVNNGGGWTTLASYNGVAESSVWTAADPVSLDAYAGQSIQLRWYFDTFDSVSNEFEGWYVDDVTVAITGPAGTDGHDYYQFIATTGQVISLTTTTPGDGPGEFANTLDPKIELYSPAGVLLASNDNGAADGRNARLLVAAASTGSYRVRVLAVGGTGGEYVLTQTTPLVVLNTNNSGPGSLRQAIINANATPGTADTIEFEIPGAGPHAIQLTSNLPALNGPVTLNMDAGEAIEVGTFSAFTFGEYASLTKTGAGTLSIGGNQSHASAATILASAGTLNLASDAGANVALSADNAGTTVNLNATQHLASLSAAGGATVVLTAIPPGSPPPYVPGDKYVLTKALSIDATSTVDIGNGAMIIDYTGASPLATVDGYLTSAFNGGLWNLAGLTSSVAAADAAGAGVTTLGFLDNDQIGYDGINGAQFNLGGGGDPVPFTSVLVKYTYYGDGDVDGDVDADDYTNFLVGFDGSAPPTWLYGDFDNDNDTDADDFTQFLTGFDNVNPVLSPPGAPVGGGDGIALSIGGVPLDVNLPSTRLTALKTELLPAAAAQSVRFDSKSSIAQQQTALVSSFTATDVALGDTETALHLVDDDLLDLLASL